MAIEIKPSAQQRIGEICAKDRLVRLSITSGGCQGFNKVWDLVDSINNDDEIFEIGQGRLAIDAASLEILGDAVIDFKTAFDGSYFTVEIPSATSTCGCGTSFSI
jgi:iron-sulfur cluster insertion protein